jgi:hypothetical protein
MPSGISSFTLLESKALNPLRRYPYPSEYTLQWSSEASIAYVELGS